MFNQNSYNQSLANIFNQDDYETRAFHSNYKEFYTRYLVYKGFGYDEFYGQHELDLSDTEKRYDCCSTIFCTQYKMNDWYMRLGAGAMVDAILDRIVHNSICIETGSMNMRKLFSGQ